MNDLGLRQSDTLNFVTSNGYIAHYTKGHQLTAKNVVGNFMYVHGVLTHLVTFCYCEA